MKKQKISVFVYLLMIFGLSLIFWLSPQIDTISFGPDSTKIAINTQIAGTLQQFQTEYPITVEAELAKITTDEQLTPVPTAKVNAENWLAEFLVSPTCLPPCWENIKPGITTLNEGISIINKIGGIEFSWLYLTPHVNSKTAFARWNFNATNWGQIITGKNSEKVAEIELHPGTDQELPLSKLIEAHGDPTSIVRGACFGEFLVPAKCGFAVVFQELGIVTYLNVSLKMKAPIEIEPNIQIASITLSLPEDISPFGGNYDAMDKLEWEGYQSYSFPSE